MSEKDVLALQGQPLSVQLFGPRTVWKYLQAVDQGKKTEYYMVWFQEGKVVEWGKSETQPPILEQKAV